MACMTNLIITNPHAMQKLHTILNFTLAGVFTLGLSSCAPSLKVSVYNPSDVVREKAVVEIDAAPVVSKFGHEIAVTDEQGSPVTTQFTYDGKLLLEGDIPARATRRFKISKADGKHPALKADTVCVGQIRHDMQDDYAWENDRGGYRLYGPSYRNGGGNVSGYDIWTKSVGYPVLADRYDDHCMCRASYHRDHGSGMDVYTVGRTLGAGMNALVVDGQTAYPCAYSRCDILDNGPLRTSARITCYPETIGEDSGVVETRMISLDKGSWLNKTVVSYEGLSKTCPMINGIVVHKQNPTGYILDPDKRFLAYADLTDNPAAVNGIIFIGVVNAETPDNVTYSDLAEPLGDAVGHIISETSYRPGESYTYYWGSGWSKGGVRGLKPWAAYLADFSETLKNPLQITIE